jgi:hypothetical protein
MKTSLGYTKLLLLDTREARLMVIAAKPVTDED